jgi:hypothetical protein
MDVLLCLSTMKNTSFFFLPMPNNSWHGRTCNRRRKGPAVDGRRRRYIQTSECTGGNDNKPCLSCQLKDLWNDSSRFKITNYVRRSRKYGSATGNLRLVNNLIGVPEYNNALPIIQVAVCDYLDKFKSLELVKPPSDYIRNPVCVKRDEELRKAEQQRVEQRHVYIIPRVIQAMSEKCWDRFRCSKYDTRYGKFQPDWVQYRIVCMKKWSDTNVSQAEIDAEATRLIELALEKDPSIAHLPVVATVQVVDDDMPDEDCEELFNLYPDLFALSPPPTTALVLPPPPPVL